MALLNLRIADMGLKTALITPSAGVPGHHSSAWDVAAMMHRLWSTADRAGDLHPLYTTTNGA